MKGITVVNNGGGGEANTASSLGTGAAVFKQKSGVDLQFRSVKATSGISVTQGTNEVLLSTAMTTRVIATTSTILATDDLILVNASAGSVTVNLPAAASVPGKVYVLKKIDGSVNPMIIDPNLSETIDGAATKQSTVQYEAFTVVSDGNSWWLV